MTAIIKGDEVNIWVMSESVSAQLALAVLIGGDGIQEDVIRDRRLSLTEAADRGAAWVARKSSTAVGIRYQSRDVNTQSGRSIVVNLAAPISVAQTFTIQRVMVTDFAYRPPSTTPVTQQALPTYLVEASSSRFSFEDLLRVLRDARKDL